MKNSEDGSDTLVQERVSTLERELNGARALLREHERHSIAARIFLDSHILDPFTDLLDKCHRFNNRVQDIAKFLSQCLIYRLPEDFQDELDLCYSKCKEFIGPEIADLILEQSHKAESLSSQPVPALFARIVCMVFLISVSVLHIRGGVFDINQRFETIAATGTDKELSPQKAPSATEFKNYAVRMFSNLMKTAGWIIQGANNRTSFQEHILSLHAAWDDLWGGIGVSISGHTYKLSFAPLVGCIIPNDHMISIYDAPLDTKPYTEAKDNASIAIGTTSLGISIESTKVHRQSEDASSIPHTEAKIFHSAVKAQVVTMADLGRALAGKIFLTDLASHTPPREKSEELTVISPTTSSWANLFGRGGSSAQNETPPRGDKLLQELVNTKRESERCRKEAQFYRKELEQSNYNSQRAIGDNRVFSRNIHELQSANARLKDHLLSSQHELASVQRKLDKANVLADTRGRELQDAQAFLSKADSLAISDLSSRVTQLNEEIFQAAVSLRENVCRKQWNLPDEKAIRCAEYVSRLIGPYLVLATHEHAKNPDVPVHPFLVQVVLQVFLNTFCVEKIRMWAPSEPIHDDYLRSLYQAIWEKEEQAVSGRWRALTRSQLRPDTSTWFKELLDSLMKVFQSASWGFLSPEAQRTVENQLSPIFKGILEVRMALGEKFTSADIEVTSIEFGQKFNRAYMEDAFGDDPRGGANTEPDTVFATAGMALRKNMPLSSQFRYEKVLPAKVVLESSLKAALEPTSSRDRGKRMLQDGRA